MMCREKTEAMLPARPAQCVLLYVSCPPTHSLLSSFSSSSLTCNALASVDTVAGLTKFRGSDVYKHHVIVGADVLDHPVDGVCHLDPHKVDALQSGNDCKYTNVFDTQVGGGVDKAYEYDEYTDDDDHEENHTKVDSPNKM